MNWAAKQHPVETIVEWLAPMPLALAMGWAGLRLGLPLGPALALGVVVLAAGFTAMRHGGGARPVPLQRFAPTEFVPVEPDELLLREEDSILELNDRLDEVGSDSRVVRLFAHQDPTPGELVDRIVDFLGEGRRPSTPAPAADANRPDASTALHEALANIRASLR